MNPLEGDLPDFEYTSHPAVQNRGIWTWSHVIYDYKGFIDNMVKLKMNTVTIWNDFVPVNAKEMIAYAHSCGIKVFWGFAWGWDTDCKKISVDDILDNADDIVRKYEREYRDLGGDGIYFQSFTELNVETINGTLIADAVTRLVNKTAGMLYEKYPDLELQFGLHATSVKDKLQYIQNVNPKIRIVWENCGSFPFSYIPKDLERFDETVSFVKEIAVLRGRDDKFGLVTKGFTKLDWSVFEHLNGATYVGVSSEFMKTNRIIRKKKIWKYFQAYWLTNADKVYEIVRTATEAKGGDLYITPLVENGMFEKNIMYPVALFSEMLWDCKANLADMINEVALRNYVDFA